MESIGQVLRSERERRGLSLEQIHQSTHITVQNLDALEQDRFDHFPNRVYARAFLRDYANFLGLDSASLLDRYEEDWGSGREPSVVQTPGRSGWKVLGYALLVLVVIGVLGAAGYYGWTAYEKRSTPRVTSGPSAPSSEEVATLPKVDKVPPPPPPPAQPEPEAVPEPEVAAEPEQPAVPDELVLEVTAVRGVWMRVKTDGVVAFDGNLPAQTVKSFQARESINIRTGMADAVQLKLNGEPQPPLGTVKQIGERTFKRTQPVSSAPQSGAVEAL